MNDQIKKIIELTRLDKNALPVFGKTTKLGEEVGELCEAVLFEQGYVQHKKDVAAPLEEGCDVILLVLDVLASCYPHHTAERLTADIVDMLATKLAKWQTIMDVAPVVTRAIINDGILYIATDQFVQYGHQFDKVELDSGTAFNVMVVEYLPHVQLYKCVASSYHDRGEQNDRS